MNRLKTDKLAFSLAEVCRLTKLDTETVESWENELDFIQSGENSAGNKIYRKRDVEIILRLKELLENQGHTLAGAKRRIEEEFGLRASSPSSQEKMKSTLFQIRERLKKIQEELE